ncbi:hypothetical protein GCM10007298_36830 [Williamsia phyllosphaerae]|uniref:Uncharacterized protein n=1 Tax=Williamsia phyllosphaerae TaxID=885042 RepID=A0ABQ1V5R6_9NOCA|nr:hypothetical protein GCM10007298_36830 [Williamsia phyllosphaerae]
MEIAASGSVGGPITPGPASCMAPYPNRVTVTSPNGQLPPGRGEDVLIRVPFVSGGLSLAILAG